MNLKNFYRIYILSFYSTEAYIVIAEKWRHWGLGFLLYLSLFVSAVSTIGFFILLSLVDFNSKPVVELLDQIPIIQLEDYKANLVD